MDEFKILTQGVAFKRSGTSRSIFFSKKQKNEEENDDKSQVLNQLNFFGESKSETEHPATNNTATKWVSERKTSMPLEDIDETSDGDWFYSDEMVSRYRKKNKIFLYNLEDKERRISNASSVVPFPIKSFHHLTDYFNVESWVVEHIKTHLHLKSPTPIQKQAIPCFLSGQNLLATAPTGSGKTLAFLLPLFILLKKPRKEFLRSLIVVPSRELAAQILRECIVFCGHKRFRCDILGRKIIRNSALHNIQRLDLGVSTPLRLVQMLKEDQINFKSLKHFVLDEADRLFDMGFEQQIDEILSFMDLQFTQLAFFSATLSPQVSRLVNSFAINTLRISIGAPMSSPPQIEHRLVFVTKEQGKLSSFRQFIQDNLIKPPALVFMKTIESATQLFSELVYDGIFVDVIHSGRNTGERDAIVKAFREKKIWILICTDVMARGVDFKGIRTVVNWDLPKTAQEYIHRVGRTGRAGQKGTAMTFFTLDDVKSLRPIVNVIRESGGQVPEWMLKIHTTKRTKRVK